MGQAEQQHIVGVMHVEVVQNGVDTLHGGRDPAVHLLQEVDPVDDGAPAIVLGEGVTDRGLERAKDIALAPSAVVDLLLGPCGGTYVGLDSPLARERLGGLWTQFIQADHDAALWRLGIESLNLPLFRAKSGSTRAPNHVSCSRQRNPSACKSSWIRLCLMARPCEIGRASC